MGHAGAKPVEVDATYNVLLADKGITDDDYAFEEDEHDDDHDTHNEKHAVKSKVESFEFIPMESPTWRKVILKCDDSIFCEL